MTGSFYHFAYAALSAALVAVSSAAPAQNDPRDKLMPRKDGQSACFRRDYEAAHLKANPRQATQSIVISLKYEDGNVEGVVLRVMMQRKQSATPYYMLGGCDWGEHKNPAPEINRVLGKSRHSHGLDCIMLESRESARESGFVAVDFSPDAQAAVAMSSRVIAAWHGFGDSATDPYFNLGREDIVFKLARTDEKVCRAMEQGLKF
jgi:hypothetical protein